MCLLLLWERMFLLMVRFLLKESLRDRQVLFWIIVFPAMLFAILSLIFGGISSGDITVKMGVYVPQQFMPMVKPVVESSTSHGKGYEVMFFSNKDKSDSFILFTHLCLIIISLSISQQIVLLCL